VEAEAEKDEREEGAGVEAGDGRHRHGGFRLKSILFQQSKPPPTGAVARARTYLR